MRTGTEKAGHSNVSGEDSLAFRGTLFGKLQNIGHDWRGGTLGDERFHKQLKLTGTCIDCDGVRVVEAWALVSGGLETIEGSILASMDEFTATTKA